MKKSLKPFDLLFFCSEPPCPATTHIQWPPGIKEEEEEEEGCLGRRGKGGERGGRKGAAVDQRQLAGRGKGVEGRASESDPSALPFPLMYPILGRRRDQENVSTRLSISLLLPTQPTSIPLVYQRFSTYG